MPSSAQPTVSAMLGRVVLPFAAGYFLSYLYRTVNAVLAPEIGRAIHLDGGDIGLMTGIYFMTFAAAQLPLGILLDRFGPRRVESILLCFAAAGAFAFSLAESVPALVVGRALVGFGVSSCLMAALKANVQFFPPPRIPLMNGIILGAGGLGAIAATAPVQAALHMTDWRGVYAGVAILTLGASTFLWAAVPDRHPPPGAGGLRAQIAEVAEIYRDAGFWRVAPATMLSMGSFMSIQGLWAGPWLRDAAGFTPDQSATGLTVMAAAMALGYLSVGAMAEKLEKLGIPPITQGAVGMGLHVLALGAMAAGWSAAPLALAAFYGLTGTACSINYAVLTRRFPLRLAGRVNTSLNLTIFVAAFIIQWGLGALIGLWDKVDGHWPPVAWAVGLGVPAVLTLLALIWQIPACRAESH
ncbi:putative transporter, Major facilitator superfamily MFS_1 [Magnetospirillum sp. XM-1]|uniref:MFS transporter n=1 Tax=Magnetospirillum sp. XM-1 TaxID=1663591 RepID=UPI00073DE5B7|nr:MFS transporter [Magnetospirillum sp. XM-1]CUW39839.1 putative transporter, Major facilitator superfamily MFS_1 [Magnetospirillum sp. XM-1]